MIRKRIISQIPNTLTLLNLVFGSISILLAFAGDLRLSAIFLLLGFHADVFDGLVARLLKVNSEIGKELDSLADLVSFGLAPAIILHVMMKNLLQVENFSFDLSTDQWIMLLIPFLLPVFAAIRLAKFNIDEDQRDKFIGLPTPANALMVISLPLIAFRQPDSFIVEIFSEPIGIILYSLIVAVLMVAPIELYALKLKGFSWKVNKFRYLFLALGLSVLIIFYHTGLFLTICLYFIFGVIFAQLKKRGIIN